MSLLWQFLADNKGTTAIEYGLIGSLITLVIIAGVGAFADRLAWLWNNNSSELVQALSK